MITPILLPKQGNTVETCLILDWKKKKGEKVKKGEIVCEIETDKAVFDIESPDDGVLLEIFFNNGEEVPVLTNIAVIGSEGESYTEFEPRERHSAVDKPNEAIQLEDNRKSESLATSVKKEIKTVRLEDDNVLVKSWISPRARNLADKLGITTEDVQGTGPDGRIIERDILEANTSISPLSLAAKDLVTESSGRPRVGSGVGERVTISDIRNHGTESPSPLDEEAIKIVALKGIRKLIAGRMLESLRNSAQLTLNSSANATALLALRHRFKNSTLHKEFQAVTINDLVQYAVLQVLPVHPELNSLLKGDQIEYHNKIHLGFAVDTPRGLMVPVIKNARDLSLLKLSAEAKRLSAACLSGKIAPEELNGATFTTTNLGSLGIESFTPVLNLPQTGILGINAIVLKPVDNGKGIDYIPHISFSLTIDHRVIDGAVGARFLQSLAKTISEIDLAITSDAMRK
ncbi:MAG: dihydrolipoamide acetyltransferase family protein [Bacteroidota bacterium]